MKLKELLAEATAPVSSGGKGEFSKSEYSKINNLFKDTGMHTVWAWHRGADALDIRIDGVKDRDQRDGKVIKKIIGAAYPGWKLKFDKHFGWVELRGPGAVAMLRGEPMAVYRKTIKPQIAAELGVDVKELVDVTPADLGGSEKMDKVWQALDKIKTKTISKFSRDGETSDGDYTWEVAIVEGGGMKFADIYLAEGGPSATGVFVIKKSDLNKLVQ